MGSSTTPTSLDGIPAAVWGVVDLVSRELSAKKEELRELQETHQFVCAENAALRDEVAVLREQVSVLRAKEIKAEADLANAPCNGMRCNATAEALKLSFLLQDLQERYSDACMRLAAQGQTTVGQGPVQEHTRQKSDASTNTTNPQRQGGSDSIWIPESGSLQSDRVSLKRKEPPSAEGSSTSSSNTIRSLRWTAPNRSVSLPMQRAIRPTPATLPMHASVAAAMKPLHVSPLPTPTSDTQIPMLMTNRSLRLDCDAYPGLYCHGNIVWSFGTTTNDALLVTPKSLFDPSAPTGKQWSQNPSLTTSDVMGQTFEMIFYAEADKVSYAGTYECQPLCDTPVELSYTTLSSSVRAALCKNTLQSIWRCRVPGGVKRDSAVKIIESEYASGNVQAVGIRLKHVGFNQKLLQRLVTALSEMSASASK